MTIKVGIIGASFAKAAYLPAFATVDDVEVVAIASARLESAQDAATAFGIERVYDNWELMLDENDIDLVGIATPTIYHAPMALKALEVGAHVICEKPMAMNSDEASEMLEKAEALQRVHIIGHELRFNPTRRKLKEVIEQGIIGEVRHANIVNISPSWGDPASRSKGDWWSLEEMGGGRLGANGSHQIDLIRYWLGEIGAVSGHIATMVSQRQDKNNGEAWIATADDMVSFSAEMRNGAFVSVFLSGVSRHNMGNHVQIFGSEGTILLSNSDERLLVATAGEDYQSLSEVDTNETLPGIGKGIWNVSFVALIHEVTSAIREGRSLREGATFADGLKCQQAMDAVRLSSKERRWIQLD